MEKYVQHCWRCGECLIVEGAVMKTTTFVHQKLPEEGWELCIVDVKDIGEARQLRYQMAKGFPVVFRYSGIIWSAVPRTIEVP